MNKKTINKDKTILTKKQQIDLQISKPNVFLDTIFPRRCPFCHDILENQEELIDKDCRELIKKLYIIKEPLCKKCGKPLEKKEQEYCFDCYRHTRSFIQGICLFRYGHRHQILKNNQIQLYHSMGESIGQFKYLGSKSYARYYIDELMNEYGEFLYNIQAQAIIPVPIHKSRYRKRGYNQAELLAIHLAEKLQIPVYTDILYRNKKTKAQKDLGQAERIKNLMEAFYLSGKINKYQGLLRIILIDDIYTTGATMEACTRRLLECGIKEVFCVSICSGQN